MTRNGWCRRPGGFRLPSGLVLTGLLVMSMFGGALQASGETLESLEVLALHTVGLPRVGLCNQVRVTVKGSGVVELLVEQG